MIVDPAVTHPQYQTIIFGIEIEIPSYRSSLFHNIKIGDKGNHLSVIGDDQCRRTEYMLVDNMAAGRCKVGRPMERRGKPGNDNHLPVILANSLAGREVELYVKTILVHHLDPAGSFLIPQQVVLDLPNSFLQ